MIIDWQTFAIRLLVGFFLAVGIGIERQWLKTRAVLKTNVLVTLGSAMFVMLSIMTPGDASPTRISAQVVSGVGFLGGGVILREGASVKGINTAATLWCAAAIGTLVGSGFLVQAYVSTVMVVGANLLLRPLVEAFKQREKKTNPVNILTVEDDIPSQDMSLAESDLDSPAVNLERQIQYTCKIICSAESEVKILELIGNFATSRQLVLEQLHSKSLESETTSAEAIIAIDAQFIAQSQSAKSNNYLEIVGLIKSEAKVDSVSWQLS